MAATQKFPSDSSSFGTISNQERTALNGFPADDTLLRDRMGLEDELRNRMGLNSGIEEDLRRRMGLNDNLEEELRNRMGLNSSIEEELRNRMGLNNGIEQEFRSRMGLSNGMSDELRNRLGVTNNIEDELQRRIGGTSGNDEELRSRMGVSHSIEQELQQRMGLSNGTSEDLQSRFSSGMSKDLQDRLSNGLSEDLQGRMGSSKSAEEELRYRLQLYNKHEQDVEGRIEQGVEGRMPLYNSAETMQQRQNQNFDNTFQQNNGESHSSEEEPNSDHLDETIEAVARNQFDCEPVIKPEFRKNCNQFMENFQQIKQEPIDYDLMAANLTAGLMNPDRRHMCAHCCKGFRSRQQLLQHTLVHSNLRKYHCNYCERSFKQLSHLHQHHRIHTGEKPYSCPLDGCGKAFPQLSNLQHHIRNHDKLAESQYQCQLCDRAYPNEATLKAHNTRMHVHSKLIPNLQKPPLSQPNQSVSEILENPDVSQPRQRKRKATRPQHINNRCVIPFSPNQSEMQNRMYQNKDRHDSYVYILDSDDDNSSDIPNKKPESSTNNNNFYSHCLSQKENFYTAQRSQEGQPTHLSDKNDSMFRDSENNPSVNFRYLNDFAYRPHTADNRSHNLPKLFNEMSRNNNHVTVSSNEMVRDNNHVSVSSNGVPGHKGNMALPSNEISQNNLLSLSSAETSRTKQDSISSTRVSSASMALSSNEIQRNIQGVQFSNEMQQYSSGVGLDLSTNTTAFSRMYDERNRLSTIVSGSSYTNNHIPRITNGLSNNHRMMDNKQNQNLGTMADSRNNFNQMMNWQRRNFPQQRRMENGESDDSSDDSESDMVDQHFQTPNLGADVYDDPMN